MATGGRGSTQSWRPKPADRGPQLPSETASRDCHQNFTTGLVAARPRRAAILALALNLDAARRLDGFRPLGDRHLEHPLVELGFDLAIVDHVWQTQRALKAAEAALCHMIVLAPILLLLLFFALDCENIVGQRDGNVLLLDAG